MLGQVVDGKYEILRLVGEGGMGAVYEARHRTTGRLAAVKLISTEDVGRNELLNARFEREAQAAAKVRSPHIVEILDAGHDAATGHPYMVMELLVGMNVHRLLRQLGPLPPELAVRIGIQTCFGLEKAHTAGVVHRDIKPANLFLSESDGGERVVKLLDFGVAKFKMDQATEQGSEGLTRTGSVLGSPMFMSPEQARGLKTIDHRADLWSLGVVLYQLLSGKTPHAGVEGIGELIITICSEEPTPLRKRAPWISPRLEEVVHGALKLAAAERYPSAAEMREALLGCLSTGVSWHIHQAMLVGLTEEERAARPTNAPGAAVATPSLAPSDDAATVALDPASLGAPFQAAAPHAAANEAEATLALDTDAQLGGASLPFAGRGPKTSPYVGIPAPQPGAGQRAGLAAEGPIASPAAARRATEGRRSASTLRVVFGLGIGIVLGVAAVVFLSTRAGSPSGTGEPQVALSAVPTHPTAAPIDPVAVAQSAAAASATTTPSGGSAAPATPTNRVRVLPVLARVLVDGKPVERDGDGSVAVDGPVGSSHTIAIHWGTTPTMKQVVITEKGPVPSQVSAPLETPTASPGGSSPASGTPAPAPQKIQF